MNSKGNFDRDWEVGDQAMLADGRLEAGVVEVTELSEHRLVVEDDEGRLELDADTANAKLRPIVGPERAREIREQFGTLARTPDADRPYHRKKVYRSAIDENDITEMIALLGGIYEGSLNSYAEDKFERKFEEIAVAQLARALDVSEDTLIRELREAAGEAVPESDWSDELEAAGDPPDLGGYEPIATFATDGEVLVGETTAYRVDVRPGAWYAYRKKVGYGDGHVNPLVCVHCEELGTLEPLEIRSADLPEAFTIDGGTGEVVDADFADAVPAEKRHHNLPLLEGSGYGPRGVKVGCGGDGGAVARVGAIDDLGITLHADVDVEPIEGRPDLYGDVGIDDFDIALVQIVF